jgi:hypothetical protein
LEVTKRGIEFKSPIQPHPNGSPNHIKYYLGKTPGVEHRCMNGIDYACISATIINKQL